MSIFDGSNIIPSKPTIQYHEFNCFRCNFPNRFVKPESFIDYKKECKIFEKRFNNLIHDLNELMAFSELHYGMNPSKDKLVEELTKIRKKYTGD